MKYLTPPFFLISSYRLVVFTYSSTRDACNALGWTDTCTVSTLIVMAIDMLVPHPSDHLTMGQVRTSGQVTMQQTVLRLQHDSSKHNSDWNTVLRLQHDTSKQLFDFGAFAPWMLALLGCLRSQAKPAHSSTKLN